MFHKETKKQFLCYVHVIVLFTFSLLYNAYPAKFEHVTDKSDSTVKMHYIECNVTLVKGSKVDILSAVTNICFCTH